MTPIEIQATPAPDGGRYRVRTLASSDYQHLQALEQELWGSDAVGQLCPYYLRLCTEHYADWCFIAFDGDQPAGYVLNFPNGKINYCATLAVLPRYQKTRVNYLLIRAMVTKLLDEDMEECRFCVEPDNLDARSVHQSLGARVVSEMDDYYHPGDKRLWSVINKADLERIRGRYTRLKLVS
jgi:ribosomal protein S18 acetylase RimI-like enzyme